MFLSDGSMRCDVLPLKLTGINLTVDVSVLDHWRRECSRDKGEYGGATVITFCCSLTRVVGACYHFKLQYDLPLSSNEKNSIFLCVAETTWPKINRCGWSFNYHYYVAGTTLYDLIPLELMPVTLSREFKLPPSECRYSQ